MVMASYNEKDSVVLVLLEDGNELEKWRFCHKQFEHDVHIGLMEDRSSLFSSVVQGKKNVVVLLSHKLLTQHGTVADELRSQLPQAQIVVMVSPEHDYSLFQDLLKKRITHVVVDPCCYSQNLSDSNSLLQITIDNLVNQRNWNVDDYLKEGTVIVDYVVSSSRQKEELIDQIASVINGDTPEHEILRQRGALLADELFENAFYAAPRTVNNVPLFSKGEDRTLSQPESIVF